MAAGAAASGASPLSQLRALLRVKRAHAWRVGLLFVLGGVMGFLLVPARAAQRSVHVTLAGEAVAVGDDAKARASIEAIARAYVRGKIALRSPGASWERTREELGARVDAERVTALVHALRDGSLRKASKSDVTLSLPLRMDEAAGVRALLPIKDDIDRAAASARIDVESGKAIAEEGGRRLDVYATLSRADDAIARGEAQIDLAIETFAPDRLAAQLEGANVRAVLGSFDTKVDAARSTKSLRAASAKVSGTVLLPGETFDFNDVVGAIRADGEGAGESQVASTLHAAAFFAGLDIVERHARSRPSASIPLGLEALVVHPTVTLRIRNSMPWPVLFVESVSDANVHAEIRGAARTREVTFARRIDKTTPFAERELADAKLPQGARVLAQRGSPGYDVTRDRIVREGATSIRARDEERYPPIPQLWRIGTGELDPKFKKPSEKDVPAILAQDEYVTLTQ